MNKTALSLMVLLAASGAARAAGTTAADFLNIGVGARPAGMGEAFVAVADETSGIFYNPAGAGFFYSPELTTMHSLWLADMGYSFIGYTHPAQFGTWGISGQYLSGPSIPKIANGVRDGDISYYDGAANLSYAYRISDTFAAGAVARGIQSVIGDSSLSTITGDFGILYRTEEEGFSFGLAGQNLFGKLGDDPLPATYRGGMAFKHSMPDRYSSLLFSLETGKSGTDPVYYAAGLEHWGGNTLGLRVGYKYYADDKLQKALDPLAAWRAGFSLRIKSVEMDYGYQPFARLGETHRLSLTWRVFGWEARWRIVPASVKADPAVFSPNGDDIKDAVFFVASAPDLKEIKTWELQIVDQENNPVKVFKGKDVLPQVLSWDGTSDNGEPVTEGVYRYRFTADGYGFKRARSDYGQITADLTPPTVSLQASTTTVLPENGGLESRATFYVSVTDLISVDRWQLSILNSKGNIVKIFPDTTTATAAVVWDGRDDFYGLPVPNGEYEVRVDAQDAAGNRARGSLTVSVYVPPRVEVREVVREAPENIEVKEEKRGLVVNLSNQVLYDSGKAELKPQSSFALNEVVNLLTTYPDNEVLIEGHTDSAGSYEKNVKLSSARAWAVYSYLVKRGIAPSRLKPKGYGPDLPLTSNKTAAGRAQNRRVEIIILKTPDAGAAQ